MRLPSEQGAFASSGTACSTLASRRCSTIEDAASRRHMDVVLITYRRDDLVTTSCLSRGEKDLIATALGRGTWDGSTLTNFKELFVVEPWWDGQGGAASHESHSAATACST